MNSEPQAESLLSAQGVLLLPPSQAAKALAISERKLWGMTHAGEIPSIKLGRCVRYCPDALRQWIASHRKGGAK